MKTLPSSAALETGRNTNLDALRAIAILMVLFRHSNYSPYLMQIGWAGFVLPIFQIQSPALNFYCYILGALLFGIAASKVIEIPVLRFRDRVMPRR